MAAALGVIGGDMRVLKDACPDNRRQVEHSLMGCIADYKYHIVIKRTGGVGPDFDWSYPLWHYSGSAVFMWPCSLVPLPDNPHVFEVVFDLDVVDLTPASISSWDNIVAHRFAWHGLADQTQHFVAAQKWPPALRVIVCTPQMRLTELVASAGWFDLDGVRLNKKTGVLHVDIADEMGDNDVLLKMTTQVRG